MMMTIATFLSLAMLFMTVCIHYCGLQYIAGLAKRWDTSRHIVPLTIMFSIALLHLLEIVIYAGIFYLLNTYTDLGSFTEKFKPVIRDYIYFSGANYTTLGMSDFYPKGHFKILAITEALAGFMMLTWSATFFYSTAGQFLNKNGND